MRGKRVNMSIMLKKYKMVDRINGNGYNTTVTNLTFM